MNPTFALFLTAALFGKFVFVQINSHNNNVANNFVCFCRQLNVLQASWSKRVDHQDQSTLFASRPILSLGQIKISVFRVTGLKILGRVGTHIFYFFFWKNIIECILIGISQLKLFVFILRKPGKKI